MKHIKSAEQLNKYASYPDWCLSQHADCPKLHTCQGVSSCRHKLTKFFTFWPWGLTPGPKFTKLVRGLQQAPIRHSAKFQPDRANGLRNVHYYNLSPFGLGANPWAKVHQNGRWSGTHTDLPSCQISSTLEISITKYLRTNKDRNKQYTIYRQYAYLTTERDNCAIHVYVCVHASRITVIATVITDPDSVSHRCLWEAWGSWHHRLLSSATPASICITNNISVLRYQRHATERHLSKS